jgi:hypothetical protein
MLCVRAVSDQGGACSSTRNSHTYRHKNGICPGLWNGHGARNAPARPGGYERHRGGDELLERTVKIPKLVLGCNVMLFRTLVY